jgi:hypothetical protein
VVAKQLNYLGSTVSSDGNIVVEIKQRIEKANAAYTHLKTSGDPTFTAQRPKSGYINHVSGQSYSNKTGTWKIDKRIASMLRGFEGRLLIRLKGLTGLGDINKDVNKIPWWIEHVNRMRRERQPRKVLKLMPQVQRSRGRPRGTWKRTYETELKVAYRTGLEIKRMAQDQIEWHQFVSTLCDSGRAED